MLKRLFKEVKGTLDFDVIEGVISKMSKEERHAAITEFLLKKGIGIIGAPYKELTLGEQYFIGMLAGLHNHRVADIQEKVDLKYFGAGCKKINFFVNEAGDYALFKAKDCLLQIPLRTKSEGGNSEDEKLGDFILSGAERCYVRGTLGNDALSNAKDCKAQGEFGDGALTRADSCYAQGNFGKDCFNYAKNGIFVADRIGGFFMPLESIVIFNSCGQIKSPPYSPGKTLIITTNPRITNKSSFVYAGLEAFTYASLEDVSKLDVFNNSFNSQIKEFLRKYNKPIPKWLEARK